MRNSALPPLSLVDTASSNWWRFRYLVVPLPTCGLPLLGCLLACTLVRAPCFYLSPFLGCFLFIKFGRVSSIVLDYMSARFAFPVDYVL
jgi:hypothetical protein